MRPIIGYIGEYFYETNKRVLAFTTLLAGLLIFLNYHFGVDEQISAKNSFWLSFLSRAALFLTAFILPYLAYKITASTRYFVDKRFLTLLLLAPFIFAFKIAFNPTLGTATESGLERFWNHVFYWPALLVIIAFILFIIWKIFDADQPFYGIKTKEMNWRPYLIMLFIMLPLIAAASTQSDFLAMYPKLKLITGIPNSDELSWWHKLLFELSYGSDFITIELFFRGFLILAFVKWAGRDAILPMACFYCTIHFGKPLGECISSYFGGLLLGIVIYNTRSIFGGLMVHLGIAWLMEIGGYIGNSIR